MQRLKTITAVIITLLSASFCGIVSAQNKTSREEYIQTYKDWAIEDMKKTGIPASIKLAQACLESSDGNSKLAQESNNHFGIKCHNDWTGKRVYHHDDARNECFRVYNNPLRSFEDHSTFLTSRDRYSKLFDLDPADYKAWAKGLKECGYATNPQYPNLLIKIIEENELYLYDEENSEALRNNRKQKRQQKSGKVVNPFEMREVKYNNGVKYIEVERGDTFASLAKEFNLREWEIPHYNDLPNNIDIQKYRYLYIEPKRNKAHSDHSTHTLKADETMHAVAHQYGMKLKKLYRLNRMEQGKEPETGTVLNLRKRIKK
ncbi:MAG: glucosaminidase domain-containing protein [Cytophagaceae bacterium]|jgi:LysM repeat protein|nr:glucosaminidase domain-containing protein [Cytophagaceae bacterium]